jgi:hypothetical protein
MLAIPLCTYNLVNKYNFCQTQHFVILLNTIYFVISVFRRDVGRSLTRIVGSNPTGGMDVCVVFIVRTVA